MSKITTTITAAQKNRKIEFMLLLATALFLSHLPFIHLPFSWLSVFFHEISHGMAAALTNGKAIKIELFFLGGGLCHTTGGSNVIVAAAGYAGAVGWGALLYLSAALSNEKYSYLLALIFILFFLGCIIFLVRDFQTFSIVFVITAFYAIAVKVRKRISVKRFLKLTGLYVILDAVAAPTDLFYHNQFNDATMLYKITGLSPSFWIICWLFTAFAALIMLWRLENKGLFA